MCQWNPDNKHPKRRCRHGHRHHELLYNDIVSTEPPVIWCNSPDCWTVCRYGTSPKVYRGIKAWISDFFFTPIHRTDEVQDPTIDEPSIKRYQTFSEFNKLRSQSSPAVPGVASRKDHFPNDQRIIDIRAEKPFKDRPVNSRPIIDISRANLDSSNQYSNVQSSMNNGPGNVFFGPFTESQAHATGTMYSPNTQTGAFYPNFSPATNTGYPYSNISANHQYPFPLQPNSSHGGYPYNSEGYFKNEMIYPYPRDQYQTRKSEPNNPTTFTPTQEMYANYQGSQAPTYYRSQTVKTTTTSSRPYVTPNMVTQSASQYSRNLPIGFPSPKDRSSSKTRKVDSSRSPETKTKPAYFEYSPDVQALLGTQAAGRYPSYSPYGITRRL